MSELIKYITTDASVFKEKTTHAICMFNENGILEKTVLRETKIEKVAHAEEYSINLVFEEIKKEQLNKKNVVIFSDAKNVVEKMKRKESEIQIHWISRVFNKEADSFCSVKNQKKRKNFLFGKKELKMLLLNKTEPTISFKDRELGEKIKIEEVETYLRKHKVAILSSIVEEEEFLKFTNDFEKKHTAKTIQDVIEVYTKSILIPKYMKKIVEEVIKKSESDIDKQKNQKEKNKEKRKKHTTEGRKKKIIEQKTKNVKPPTERMKIGGYLENCSKETALKKIEERFNAIFIGEKTIKENPEEILEGIKKIPSSHSNKGLDFAIMCYMRKKYLREDLSNYKKTPFKRLEEKEKQFLRKKIMKDTFEKPVLQNYKKKDWLTSDNTDSDIKMILEKVYRDVVKGTILTKYYMPGEALIEWSVEKNIQTLRKKENGLNYLVAEFLKEKID